jgi:PAS domain S-box-containing protein
MALNLAGRIQMWNVGAQLIYGYSKDEAVGMDSRELYAETDRKEGIVDQMSRTCLEQGRWEGLVSRLRKNNERFTARVVMNLIHDPAGTPVGFLLVSKDITSEEKRHAKHVIDSEEATRNLARASSHVLGTVTDLNRLTEELNEYPRDTVSRLPFKRYFLKQDPPIGASDKATLAADSALQPPKRRELERSGETLDPTTRNLGFGSLPDAAQRLVELSEDAVIAVDREGWITDANPQMERYSGYAKEELLGTRFPLYFSRPDDAAAGIETTARHGLVRNVELTLRSRAGYDRLVSLNAADLGPSTGRQGQLLVSARDLTELKKLEAALRESQNYNRVLVESNIDALMTTDVYGRISDVNRQAEAMTGLSRDRLVGTLFKEYFTEPAAAEAAIARVVVEGRVSDVELKMRTSHGTVDVSYNATTFRDTNGQLRGVFASARDITEKRRLHEQLEERNRELEVQNQRVQEATRLKSEFLANMSHELRTPLNSIIGFSDFLAGQKDGRMGPEQREYLEDIRNSGNHLLELINDILDLSKVESGRMELHPELFSPKQAIAEVCSVVKRMAEDKGLQLHCSVAPRLESVTIDPLRFKQILYNLVSNAVKFTDSEGRIDVRVKRVNEQWFQLEVSDTGIGIAPKDLPRLFREFEQLDSGPGRHYEGSGLGLSLTKKLVELQGGSIGVKSTVGQGTTFEIVLPAHLPIRETELTVDPTF